MNWKDKNNENLLRKASDGELDAVERAQLVRNLAEDSELRQQALEMARMQHDDADQAEPVQEHLRAKALHDKIMRIAAADAAESAVVKKAGLFHMGFTPVFALGAAAAIMVFIALGSNKIEMQVEHKGEAAGKQGIQIEESQPFFTEIEEIPNMQKASSAEISTTASAPADLSTTAAPLSPTAASSAVLGESIASPAMDSVPEKQILEP